MTNSKDGDDDDKQDDHAAAGYDANTDNRCMNFLLGGKRAWKLTAQRSFVSTVCAMKSFN